MLTRLNLDSYVIDTLMPDLVGHDRRPAAFLVYLFLLCRAIRTHRDTVAVSLQTIATQTGLAKSTVQAALRHLQRRRLIGSPAAASTTTPLRVVLRPWQSG
jgi:hypothetical protein